MRTTTVAAVSFLLMVGCEAPPGRTPAADAPPPTTEVVPVTPAPRPTAPDTLPPRIGAPIAFDRIDAHAVTLRWGEAADDRTPAGELAYAVAAAPTAEALDTLEEIETAVATRPMLGWSPHTTGVSLAGLTDATPYWFAVLVRDAAGNRAFYPPARAFTDDATPPQVGTQLTFSPVLPYAVVVGWGAARDNVTPADALEYELIRADEASAGAQLETYPSGPVTDMPFTPSLETIVEGLAPGSSWWFTVRVRDQAGNIAEYPPRLFTMP